MKRIKEALQAHMWPNMTLKPRPQPGHPAARPKPQDALPDLGQEEPSQSSDQSSAGTSTTLPETDVTKCMCACMFQDTYALHQLPVISAVVTILSPHHVCCR